MIWSLFGDLEKISVSTCSYLLPSIHACSLDNGSL